MAANPLNATAPCHLRGNVDIGVLTSENCTGRIDQAVLHPRPQEVDVFLAMDEHGAGVHGRSGTTRPLTWTSGTVSPVETPGSGPGDQQLKQTLTVFCAGFFTLPYPSCRVVGATSRRAMCRD